jgi:hypothetical protein
VGKRRVQTLKAIGAHGGAAISRGEWEWPVRDDKPDLALAASAPAASRLPPDLDKQLQPIVVTDVMRTARTLDFQGSTIEAVLDSGSIVAGDQKQPVHELEGANAPRSERIASTYFDTPYPKHERCERGSADFASGCAVRSAAMRTGGLSQQTIPAELLDFAERLWQGLQAEDIPITRSTDDASRALELPLKRRRYMRLQPRPEQTKRASQSPYCDSDLVDALNVAGQRCGFV